MHAFNNATYLDAQIGVFENRLARAPAGGRVYIEFGGKPVDDQHAGRVLPGYNPDAKVALLEHLHRNVATTLVVAVSAKDLLRPRIRGDSQLFYDQETVALVRRLRSKGLTVDAGVITMVESACNTRDRDALNLFSELAFNKLGMRFVEYPHIPGYPDLRAAEEWKIWNVAERLQLPSNRHVLVMSPGGGSGKFGVCLAELYRDYVAGVNSTYLKFETFPVFDLPPNHLVNRAFVAATADLGNIVCEESLGGLTCYDKDIQNFQLLRRVHGLHCPNMPANPITDYKNPSDMSVNRLTAGFVDEETIKAAAAGEIKRRIRRYRDEVKRGVERAETIAHLQTYG